MSGNVKSISFVIESESIREQENVQDISMTESNEKNSEIQMAALRKQ